jgi:hypothetical protein
MHSLYHKGPLLGHGRPSGGIYHYHKGENFTLDEASLLPTAVTITNIIHPARPMMRDAGPAHNGTNDPANDCARRPCYDGARARSYCHAGEGSLILRIRRYRKRGQGCKCCSNTKNKNFTHDRLSSLPGA